VRVSLPPDVTEADIAELLRALPAAISLARRSAEDAADKPVVPA
jgi:hypothetical protein